MYNKVSELLELLKSKNLVTRITTNGTLLDNWIKLFGR